MPHNFCKKNIPANFEIDYVRVYQQKEDDRHILGCSPPSRPTKEWIEGHRERYVLWESEEGSQPLRDIQRGGVTCNTSEVCGGSEQGYCDDVLGCLCRPGWTGPRCLSPFGDATTDMYKEVYPTKRALPKTRGVIIVFVVLLVMLSIVGISLQKKRAGYTSIPSTSFDEDPANGISLHT